MKDFGTLATWALVVVVAVDSGWKVVVRCKRRRRRLSPLISFFEFGGVFLLFFSL